MKKAVLLAAIMAFSASAFALNAWPSHAAVDTQIEKALHQQVTKVKKLETNLQEAFEACQKELLNYKTFKPSHVAQSWLKVMDSYNDLRAVSEEAVIPWSHKILQPLDAGWSGEPFYITDFVLHHSVEWYPSGGEEFESWVRTLKADHFKFNQ